VLRRLAIEPSGKPAERCDCERRGNLAQVIEASIPAVLRERASLQPDDVAVTFIDYDQDWDGVAESLTWSQLYGRASTVAHELDRCGSTGDRAVILAPQGLDYMVGFLGALQAGQIAVPLSVPLGGAIDERVGVALSDTSPSAVLTTSSVASIVAEHVGSQVSSAATSLIEVDRLSEERRHGSHAEVDSESTVYLQYTSGSTRQPAGVMMSHRNLLANFEQSMSDYFADYKKIPPPDTTVVSWLPFYHDMGLMLAMREPILLGFPSVLMSPVAFLQRPARWMQLLASNSHAFSAGPNFAFELAVRKTSDDDMAGLDLGDVLGIVTGSERVHPATLRRFTQRFARFNLRESVIRPSYGLAEATVYVSTRAPGEPPKVVRFDPEKLSDGNAEARAGGGGTPLVSYGVPQSPMVRIVNPDTSTECPDGTTGEVWVHGDNVAAGYWGKPQETERTFNGVLVGPTSGTPESPWLRTGDLGFISDGELFIVGRIKDLLIVYGRNHSPDDIEATVQEITGGRVAAISVPDGPTEKLVTIIELKKRGESAEELRENLATVRRDVASAVFNAHGLSIADLVLAPPGSIPITTSGKVRRAACVEHYRYGQFGRLDLQASSATGS
jgi:long-chain fatty acid adenylyltransferase FadD28